MGQIDPTGHNAGYCWCGTMHPSMTWPTFSWPSTTYTADASQTYVRDCHLCPPQSPYVARHRA